METQAQMPTSSGLAPESAANPLAALATQSQVTPNPSTQVDEMTKRILTTLLQSAQRKQFVGHPQATSVPGQQSTVPPEYMQQGPQWGKQRFFYTLGKTIQNAVAKEKERKLVKAEADWQYMEAAFNELYTAQASNNQQALQAAQSKIDAFMSDPKKLKEMAKALNQDWLNPEKTTVYGEALKSVTSKKEQEGTKKAQAAQGLKGIFQNILRRRQQPQLDDTQRKTMAREIEAKAPISSGASAKDQLQTAQTVLDIEKASQASRENYFPPTPDEHGVLRSVSKTDPHKSVVIKDSETGEVVKGVPKGAAPKVLQSNGVPYGIARNGKILTPESPEWSKEDQNAFHGALEAAHEKQQLRIDPIIADQIGEPPNPAEYKNGRSDPEYAKALSEYGSKAEQIKNRMAATSGAARAKAFNEYRPVQVMDEDGNVYYTTAKDAISQKMAGAGEGVKLRPREAQIKDIEAASKQTREAINALDRPFSPSQVAKLHLALTTPDETIAQAEMTTLATQELTEKQQDFVIWIKQLNERAMSLRNVAGMGTGAQDLRNAIRDMIPGVRSGSKQMMNKQLDAFENQVKILKGGIAHPGKNDSKYKDPLKIF